MKKLLLILLCVPLTYYFFTGCSSGGASDNPGPTMESVIVGKKWIGFVPSIQEDGMIIFELDVDRSLRMYTYNDCLGYQDLMMGDLNWIIVRDTIKYTYILNQIEYTEIFAVVAEYSSNQIKIVLTNTSNSICNLHIPSNETKAIITVVDINGTVVEGAKVRLHQDGQISQSGQFSGVSDSAWTDSSGQTEHVFENEAILNIDVIKILNSNDTLTGSNVIRLLQQKTVCKIIEID